MQSQFSPLEIPLYSIQAMSITQTQVVRLSHLKTWWRHEMETFFPVTGTLWGEFIGEFPSQKPVTRSFDFSLIWAWTKVWANNRNAGDLWRHCAHYDVTVMIWSAFHFVKMAEHKLSNVFIGNPNDSMPNTNSSVYEIKFRFCTRYQNRVLKHSHLENTCRIH